MSYDVVEYALLVAVDGGAKTDTRREAVRESKLKYRSLQDRAVRLERAINKAVLVLSAMTTSTVPQDDPQTFRLAAAQTRDELLSAMSSEEAQ